MKIRRILCIGMVLVLLCGLGFEASAEEPAASTSEPTEFEPGENMVQAETDSSRYSLWINAMTAAVCLVDLDSGAQWWTNSQTMEIDAPYTAAAEEEMRSQLIVNYFDENLVSRTVCSARCVEENAVELSYAENGFQVIYYFTGENENFSITLLYRLEEECLKVSIPADGIEEMGESRISEVTVLPYLFSGNTSQDGYLIIPDGSGALMRFDDPKPDAEVYRQKVYGNDTAVSRLYQKGDEASVLLPVLGMIREGRGLLAVIDGNEAAASLTATPSGKYSDCASAGVAFTLCQTDTAIIPDKDWKYKEYTVASDHRTAYDCSISVYPLAETDNYSGVAACYRELLNKQYDRQLLENVFSGTLQFYGQGWKETSFIGIPIKKDVTATTLQDVTEIMRSLSDQGLGDVSVTLTGFGSESYERRTTDRVRPDGALGGTKELNNLIVSLPENMQLYWNQNVTHQYNTGLFQQGRVIKGLNNVQVKGSHLLPSTYALAADGRYWWYLRPAQIKKAVERIDGSLKASCGLGLPLIGNTLYSDFNDSSYLERQESLEIIEDILAVPQREVAVSGGNLYAAVRAALVTEAYGEVTLYDCMSEAIPFYGLIFFGYVRISGFPVNAETDWQTALLDCLEYGVAPAVQITAAENRELRETTLSGLINTCFENNEEPMVELFTQYHQAAAELVGSAMLRHSRENGVVTVEYSNGKTLLINRTEQPVETAAGDLSAGEWIIC